MVDNLERTLTFVSPAKEGPGVSCLDRTLPDDKGGVMFFREMARLKSEKKAAEARATSASCVLRPIGKVECGVITGKSRVPRSRSTWSPSTPFHVENDRICVVHVNMCTSTRSVET